MDGRAVPVVLELECAHIQAVALIPTPNAGEFRYCPVCRVPRLIVSREAEFRIVCKGCVLRRSFGAARLEANFAADRHLRKYPTHTLHVLQGNKILTVRAPKIFLQELPFDDTAPPF